MPKGEIHPGPYAGLVSTSYYQEAALLATDAAL